MSNTTIFGSITPRADESALVKREKKYFGRFRKPLTTVPNLVAPQVDSYKWLVEKGLAEVFKEFSAIKDYSGKKFELSITEIGRAHV